MTKQESQAIWNAIQPWYQFLRKSPLDAEWHETCKAYAQQFLERVTKLEDKPPPPAPSNETTTKGVRPPKRGHRTNGKQEKPTP